MKFENTLANIENVFIYSFNQMKHDTMFKAAPLSEVLKNSNKDGFICFQYKHTYGEKTETFIRMVTFDNNTPIYAPWH